MLGKPVYQTIVMVATLAGSLLAASAALAKDTRTEEAVFDFSSPFVSSQGSAAPVFNIWKVNRIDGSLYLCQTTSANVRCKQVAGPSDQLGPFTLSDAFDLPAGAGGTDHYVWRLNRWTGTQELCVASGAQPGCSR